MRYLSNVELLCFRQRMSIFPLLQMLNEPEPSVVLKTLARHWALLKDKQATSFSRAVKPTSCLRAPRASVAKADFCVPEKEITFACLESDVERLQCQLRKA